MRSFPLLVLLAALAAVPLAARLETPRSPQFASASEARSALDAARAQQRQARLRGERLERLAAQSGSAADRSLQQAAALAARVQQAEAAIVETEARLAIVRAERRALDVRLARERAPVAKLAGALETLSRRPVTLAVFQPGSLTDLVHTRAVLEGAVPLVERRTAGLRRSLESAAALEREAAAALADRKTAQATLGERRSALLAAATAQRRQARAAAGDAAREAARAQVLAEETRNLDALVGRLAQAGSLRSLLASLPGPVPRPADPAAVPAPAAPPSAPASAAAAPAPYQLPAQGRIVAGFGEAQGAGTARRPGIALSPAAGAQVVAPGAGRIAFAAPYRGYGHIVIVEHAGGWTSLITGLASLSVEVGQSVVAGSPLGRAPGAAPQIGLELRRGDEAVNPLDRLR